MQGVTMHHSSLASLLQQMNRQQAACGYLEDDWQGGQSDTCQCKAPQLRAGNPVAESRQSSGGARGRRKDGTGKAAALPFIPPSAEVELQRHHLIHLAQYLDSLTDSLSEAKAETELLVAERSMVICKLEVANKALLFGRDMDARDLDSSDLHTEGRVAALRGLLPPNSSARRLSERSDLKEALEALQQQLLNLHSVWHKQSVHVEQDRSKHERALDGKHAELQACQVQLQECCKDLDAVMQEEQIYAAEAQGLRDQLLEAEVLVARLQEESQSDARCLAHKAAELREQLLAVQTELEHERARNHEKLLAVQTEMEQQQQQMRENHAQEMTSLEANHALAHQELQRRIAALNLELQGSTTRRERAEALQRESWQQNQELRRQADRTADQLVQENAKLKEEQMNLKIVVDEAERQLLLMQQDLQEVKKHQHLALQEREQQLEELAKRDTATDPARQSSPHPRSPLRPKKKAPQRGKPWILV